MGKYLKKRRITMKKVYLKPDIYSITQLFADVMLASGEIEIVDIWATNSQEGEQV